MSTYRYPGAQPFTAHDRRIFYGREEDTRRLAELILLEQMVVLYAKSGLGKSSILNAAVIPHLQESGQAAGTPVFAITLRFGSAGTKTPTPLQNILERLHALAPTSDWLQHLRAMDQTDSWTARFDRAAPLWQALKSVQEAHPKHQLLLVFDQFEELSTYPPATIRAFASQLAQALYQQVPQAFRKVLESSDVSLNDSQREALFKPLHLKTVFVIRSDRLSFLDTLKPYLPNLLHKTYQLKPLNRLQAEDAILNPAYLNDSDFAVSRFDYDDNALQKVLDYLDPRNDDTVDTTQLQRICQYAERLVGNRKIKKKTQKGIPEIYPDELGDLKLIFRRNYDAMLKEIEAIGQDEREKVQKLIEDDLIFEPDKRRLSLDKGIIDTKGISKKTLSLLVDKHHVLRVETNSRGDHIYELSHDTLVEPILEVKKIRLEKERRREMAKDLRQADAQRLRKIFIGLGVIAFVVVSSLSGFYFDQASQTRKALEASEINLIMARLAQIEEKEAEIQLRQRDYEVFKLAAESTLAQAATELIDSLREDTKSLKALLPSGLLTQDTDSLRRKADSLEALLLQEKQ